MSQPAARDLQGRVVVVTGANQGIGKETARALADRGATLVLVCRSRARGEAALAELAATATGPLELVLGDLSSMAEVEQVGAKIAAAHPKVHALVNNAGATFGSRALSADGFELTFALNHLAPFVLTRALLPALRAAGDTSAPPRGAAGGRVVTVSSMGHKMASPRWDDLQNERWPGGLQVYCQSKLWNILFTVELARRLEGSGVTANSLHPGGVRSGFGHNDDAGWFGGLMKLATPFLIGPDKGARTSIYLAASPEVEGVTGQYFVRCRPARPSALARDPEAARRLWAASEALVGPFAVSPAARGSSAPASP